jgi:membrane protease YdiL (CAAX protease family)
MVGVQYFRELSHRAEFAFVITVAFGYFILASVSSVFSAHSQAQISEAGLQFLVLYELVVLSVLAVFLAARGWDLQQLGLMLARSDPGAALVLGVVAYVAYAVVWYTLGQSVPGASEIPDDVIEPNLRIHTVLLVSVINGLFEEIFVCGYVISALRKTRSVMFAINVSVAIRLTYHLYQGAAGVVSIVPIGLVFAHWYARTGRLWPIAIAHCLLDVYGLWPYLES